MRADQGIPMRRRSSRPHPAGSVAEFIWGVSTSSLSDRGRGAPEDGRGPSVWDTYCAGGKVVKGDTGDVACDHYHRYAEDIALMRELGVSTPIASRSAWPRVLPRGRGGANEPGLDFYDRLIDALLAAGIEPWMCLYPLGPAAGARGSRRLDGARHRRLVRRLRRAGGTPLRRPGEAVRDHQ